MAEELKSALFYGLMTGFAVGAARWVWSFFYRRALSFFGERLLIE